MATYTDNYNLIKPTYAETADIVPLNNNFEKIDEVMHASQTSLAPAYDQAASYQPGDVVMYELNMYKCTGATSGAWDPSKWTRTTASETGGGGSVDFDIYGEASGTAEASFSDGAEASLVECEIGIVPSQDLHGYSKPWAGGAGKNKLNVNINDYTTSGVTITNSNGVITLENTATANVTINLRTNRINISDIGDTYKLVDDGSFTFSSDIYLNIRYYDSNGSAISNQSMTSGKSMNLSVPSNAYSFMPMIIVKSGIATNGTVKPMLMLQTETDATFAPYSNICPISGHTDVTITVASTSGGSGDDTTVSLGRTVYKGWVNLSTGEGAITGEYFDLSNAGATFYKSALTGADRFYSQISTIATDMKTSGFNKFLCDYFEEKEEQSEEVGTAYIQTGWLNIQMPKDMFATGGAFKTWIESESVHIVYELATPQTFNLTPTQVETLLGQNYVSHDGGGTISLVYVKGDAPIKPNPAGAEIPLTGLEIDGEKFSIPNGERTQNRLWSYMINNGGTIVYDGSIISLSDNITNYDELVVEVVSAQQDLSDNWRGSNQIRINVEALINAINPYNMVICTYDNRSSKLTFTTNTLQKTMGLGDINGIVNVYGIKYNG